MDAVIVVDKPLSLTSFDVVARVRRALHLRRVGHAGTLDPLATGVLVVCLGAATKVVPYLMDADKVYRATARLGVTTDTDDADPRARVLFRAAPEALRAVTPEAVTAALAGMVGHIVQKPPRFSALKHEGQRLYDLARAEQEKGAVLEVPDKPRTVRIDDISVDSLELAGDAPSVTFTVRCGKGTYIRSIARDLGEELGVGAHLTSLRRLRVGPFDESCAVPPEPEALSAARRFSLGEALGHLPKACVDEELALRVRQGQLAALSRLQAPADVPAAHLSVVDPGGNLVAIVERDTAADGWRIARGF